MRGTRHSMDRFGLITLRTHELPGYRAAVIACTRPEELELCERLLGQLASLEAQALDATPDVQLSFAPPPGGAGLARRAVEQLRAKPLRRRFKRERERQPRSALRRSRS
jgi:hypothetical protein